MIQYIWKCISAVDVAVLRICLLCSVHYSTVLYNLQSTSGIFSSWICDFFYILLSHSFMHLTFAINMPIFFWNMSVMSFLSSLCVCLCVFVLRFFYVLYVQYVYIIHFIDVSWTQNSASDIEPHAVFNLCNSMCTSINNFCWLFWKTYISSDKRLNERVSEWESNSIAMWYWRTVSIYCSILTPPSNCFRKQFSWAFNSGTKVFTSKKKYHKDIYQGEEFKFLGCWINSKSMEENRENKDCVP